MYFPQSELAKMYVAPAVIKFRQLMPNIIKKSYQFHCLFAIWF